MSSKFVAEGATVEPLSQADEWTKAREQIEIARKSKEDSKTGTQEGGKSLYEHLQEQRAAKQEAFEEATKLRHQFRPLNDSEAEFLAQVVQNEQQKEQQLRNEMAAQLKAFRQERIAAEETDQAPNREAFNAHPDSSVAHVDWTASKKRRKPPTDLDLGVHKISKRVSDVRNEGVPVPQSTTSVTTATPSALVAYDSDSDG